MLRELIEESIGEDVFKQMKIQKRLVKLLTEDIGVEQPMRAIYQIKRMIASGKANEITLTKIRQWGR